MDGAEWQDLAAEPRKHGSVIVNFQFSILRSPLNQRVVSEFQIQDDYYSIYSSSNEIQTMEAIINIWRGLSTPLFHSFPPLEAERGIKQIEVDWTRESSCEARAKRAGYG